MMLLLLDKLKIEFEDLQEKVNNLESFIQSKEFQNLSSQKRFLLYEQLTHMKNYKEVLKIRIGIIENEQRTI